MENAYKYFQLHCAVVQNYSQLYGAGYLICTPLKILLYMVGGNK